MIIELTLTVFTLIRELFTMVLRLLHWQRRGFEFKDWKKEQIAWYVNFWLPSNAFPVKVVL